MTDTAWVDTAPETTSTTSTPRRRRGRDAPHWILVGYAITQAVVTTLMVFDVIHTTTLTSAVTAVALISYVVANEMTTGRWRRQELDP